MPSTHESAVLVDVSPSVCEQYQSITEQLGCPKQGWTGRDLPKNLLTMQFCGGRLPAPPHSGEVKSLGQMQQRLFVIGSHSGATTARCHMTCTFAMTVLKLSNVVNT